MKTARQIISEELHDYVERVDIEKMARGLTALERQNLEEETQINEYGKWCCLVGDKLGYKPQLKFRGARPEQTEWDAIRDIDDETAMTIHAAIVPLPPQQQEVIYRLYQYCQPFHVAREQMEIGTGTLDLLRLESLRSIAGTLRKKF